MDEKKYSQLYQALLQEVLQFHNGNQRRIRKGMLSLLLVPLVFLVLLFLSEGSRVIFLLLWIVSMFGIAAYLIAVEYIDYEMQNKVKKITKKEVELDQLTPLPSAMPQLLPLLRGRGQEPDLPPDPPQEEQESFAQSAAQAEEVGQVLTVGEVAAIAARMNEAITGDSIYLVDSTLPWYASYVDYLEKLGVEVPDPVKQATRCLLYTSPSPRD